MGTFGAMGGPMAPAAPVDPWQQVLTRLRVATLGEFEIVREVGRGGMAAVYLAKDMTLGRKVAIKVMAPALLAGEGMLERFKNEAVTVASLSHPNIISVYAVRQSGDLQFFVMKFVEGKSLDHIIRDEGALPIPVIRGLLFMIGVALGYAHRRNVIHRDIKPGNILLDEEGNAIVTDFGIAKVTHDSKLTGTGIVIGTPTYISPEQCYARPVTAASDQYSLGIVAYEMLTGRVPFEGSPFTVMQAHTEKPVPSIRQARPDCPAELEAAVMRMLAKDPAERWPSIQHALAGLGATALPEGDPARVHLAKLAVAGLTRTDEILAAPTPVPGGTDGNSRSSGASASAPPPYVASVAILAPPESVEVGDVFNLGASARNAAGDTMPNARATWASDNPAVAAVDKTTGVVRAVAPGTATITVSAEGVQNAVTVTVGPRRVAAVNVSIPPGSVRVGDRVHLAAVPEDKHHGPIAQPVRWLSEDPAIASVAEDGTLSAKAPGSVLVWAEADGVRGTARVEVSPAPVVSIKLGPIPETVGAGETFTVTATPVDGQGNELRGRVCTWSSGNEALASVTADGVVQTRRSGLLRLVCTCEGKTATATISVGHGAVQSVFISPPPPVIEAGAPFTLEAWVVSESGAVIDSSEVSWQSSDAEVATVATGGRVKPRTPGDVTITASAGGVDASVNFSVVPSTTGWVPPEGDEPVEEPAAAGAFSTSPVFPTPAPDFGGSPPEFAAGALPDAPAAEEGSVAVADETAFSPTSRKRTSKLLLIGLPLVIVGVAAAAMLANRQRPVSEDAGTVGVRDSVVGPVPGTVSLAGVPATVTVGDTFTVMATVVDSTRTPVPATAGSWRSSNPEIVAVDSATGRVTAIAPGEASIEALVAGQPAAAKFVVAARPSGPIARIVITPTRLRVIEGRKQQLTANLVDSANAPVIGAVTWQIEDTTVASIDATGNITARKPGRTNVVARSDTITTKIPLTVASKDGETDAEAIRAQIEQFLAALNGRNAQRVTALYTAESPQDKQNLDVLLGALKQPGANLRATALSVAAPEIGWTEATATFTIRLSWKPATGAAKTQTVPFKATLEKGTAGANGWKLLGVRATEKLQ
ncbi:MAG: Ig-like domain-containing protein [Gemmatimonadota bacterium]|nr:Ig-like domain-containing protein [Gemmatimonadota bacterium]